MNLKSIKYAFFLSIFIFVACEDPLEEKVYSELTTENLLNTEEGIQSVLFGAYAYAHRETIVSTWSVLYLGGMPAGETWGQGGSIESIWQRLIDFTWDSNHEQILPTWASLYNAIRNANIVLDNVQSGEFSEDFRSRIVPEARFIRAYAYSELFNLFGAVPLQTSTSDDLIQPKASEEELKSFIEQELTAAAEALPVDPVTFGRASKGAALGILAKFYLNTKQWQKTVDITGEIIALGEYNLVPEYSEVFALENEGNDEILWALPKHPAGSTGAGQAINALVFPPDFPRPYPNNGVYAARTYLFDSFVNSFENTDERQEMIVTQYVSTSTNQVVQGLGNNKSFPYKYEFDPNSMAVYGGNDILVVRYADILLTRAEALNELSGPSQEVIDLINQVRERAGATPLNLSDFNQETLRAAILQERAWEFWFEGKAREDQIRHGVFISNAVERGKSARPYHVLYPIPQVEIDANPLLEQNEGY